MMSFVQVPVRGFDRAVTFLRAGVVLAAVTLAGCGPTSGGRVVSAESGATDVSIPRPAFTLTDTDGMPYAFAERTAGTLTFLEFGYTNCPDVCPVHMANLSTVIANLAPSDRMRLTVVFVTVDPDRDSAAALRKWLNAFSVDFIGLRGTREEVDAVQQLIGFGGAIVGVDSGGATTVTHAAPVVVFTADDTAHVMYPFGTRQADWIRDMPRLLARKGHRRPANASSVAAPSVLAPSALTPSALTPSVERAYVVIPAAKGPAAIYFAASNPTGSPDSILSVATEAIGPASLHESVHDHLTNTMSMQPLAALAVPARGTARLVPGGAHGMISPLGRALVRGERIALTVQFARAGAVRTTATVITYADVDTATTTAVRK